MKKPLTRKQKREIASVIRTIFGVLLGLLLSLPFIWMIFCAFQENSDSIYTIPPVIPDFLNFTNFANYLSRNEFWLQLGNTLLLVVSNMVIGTSASLLVAYGFARFKAKGKKVAFTLMLSTMMLPWVVTMVPAYMLFNKLNMIGTFWPLILPSIGGSAYNIFLLYQFFRGIPKELDEAAKIDGCNSFQTLIRILLPNCWPILATMIIFSFIGTWSDYVGPSIYIDDPSHYTLALGLFSMKQENFQNPQWQLLFASGVIYTLPMAIIYIVCQKAFVRGAVGSAIK